MKHVHDAALEAFGPLLVQRELCVENVLVVVVLSATSALVATGQIGGDCPVVERGIQQGVQERGEGSRGHQGQQDLGADKQIGHASGRRLGGWLGTGLHAQNVPGHIRPEVFAPHGAIGGALNQRAALCGNATLAALPLPDRSRTDAQPTGERRGRSEHGDCALDGGEGNV